jgi:hypothetical protein
VAGDFAHQCDYPRHTKNEVDGLCNSCELHVAAPDTLRNSNGMTAQKNHTDEAARQPPHPMSVNTSAFIRFLICDIREWCCKARLRAWVSCGSMSPRWAVHYGPCQALSHTGSALPCTPTHCPCNCKACLCCCGHAWTCSANLPHCAEMCS